MVLTANSVAGIRSLDSGRGSGDGAAIAERIRCSVQKTSLGVAQWNDPHAQGPGVCFVIERDSATACVEPMGTNRWPVEDCASVFASRGALCEAAGEVAFACDGAVVVHDDGTIKKEMVRMKQLSAAEREEIDSLPYGGWMGARRMSAPETSTRDVIGVE